MEFNIYDMLVFEDEDGNIYQDCVCEISYRAVYIASSEDEEDEYNKIIECNYFALYFDCNGTLYNIDTNRFADEHNYKLKEIWTRTDEDTYKKVWYKIDPDMASVVKNLSLHEIADKLLEDEYIEDASYYLTEEQCLEILSYIKEKTSKTYKITRHENDYSDKTTYDYTLAESDMIEFESEYWPCYAR